MTIAGKDYDVLTLDFETYYGPKYSLSLQTMNTFKYVSDEQFQIHGVGVKLNDEPTRYFDFAAPADRDGFSAYLNSFANHRRTPVALLAHNTPFDGYILHHHFDWHPDFYLDTMAMSRGMFVGYSASLKELAMRLWPNDQSLRKGDDLVKTYGLRKLPPEIAAALKHYCIRDVDLTHAAFKLMLPYYPETELELINLTNRFVCEPWWEPDAALAQEEVDWQVSETQRIIAASGVAKTTLSSNPQFLVWLDKQGITPGTKLNAKEEEIPALGQKDWEYQKMVAAHPEHAPVWEARKVAKSNIQESRARWFVGMDTFCKGKMPVPLNYYGADTGRFSGGEKLNLQNLPRIDGRDPNSGRLRRSLLAPKGMTTIVRDLSNIESRVLAYVAGEDYLLDLFRNDQDAYLHLASNIYGFDFNTATKKTHGGERNVGKVACIAAGEPILTDTGFKAIENISITDKLWDGCEFVTHRGAICNGVKPTIEYLGVRATPDHIVFLEDGRQIPFGAAASRLETLARARVYREDLWAGEGYQWRPDSSREACLRACAVYELQIEKIHKLVESATGADERMSALLTDFIETLYSVGSSLRRHYLTLSEPPEPSLEPLWRARDQMLILIADGIHTLCREAPAARGLQGDGDRQDRQRWALLSWESALSNAARELQQQAHYAHNTLQRTTSASDRCVTPLAALISELYVCGSHRFTTIADGIDDRCDKPAFSDPTFRQTEREVWDILDAGRRNRFTVRDRIVHNCLGLGYGMGANKFWVTMNTGPMGMPPIPTTYEEAADIVRVYRQTNAQIKGYWDQCTHIIQQMYMGNEMEFGPLQVVKNALIMPNGMALQYPNLTLTENQWGGFDAMFGPTGPKKKVYGGLLTENIVQALSRVLICTQWLEIERRLKENYGLDVARTVHMVHDELIVVGPEAEADQILAMMGEEMSRTPDWCIGLPLDSDGGYAREYSK